MKTYRVCIIGCGPRGAAAGRAYVAHPRAEVVGVCDLVPERADALGDALGVAGRFGDVDRMLAAVAPDIAVIPTGTEFHYPLCLRALEHGCHIDVEKPLCTDLQEADALLARARAGNRRVAVHHQGRVGAACRAVRAAIAEGRIGEPRYLVGSDKGYYGGYGLMNIGTHLINNFLGLAGHCRSVTASALAGGRPITPEDVLVAPGGMGVVAGERITAGLEFESGVTATLLLHRFPRVDGAAYGIEVLGSEGRLFWKLRSAWWLPTPHYLPDGEHDRWQPLPLPAPPVPVPAGVEPDELFYVSDFVHALDEGGEHECSGAEGAHVLEAMMAILESAAYGRRVDLPQAARDHPLLRWRAAAGPPPPAPGPRDYGAFLAAEDARLAARRG